MELGGQNDEMDSSFRSLQLAVLLAVFLVYLVMAAQFESFVYPLIIMFTVPLALTGAIYGLFLRGLPVSVIAVIGAIMLAGIVVNNGIVLVDRINQLRRAGLPLADAVQRAGAERLRPILMTTATTVLGLLPMALGLGEGAELRAPLAVTVISGLLLATVLTLVVVPVIYTLLSRARGPGPVAGGRRRRTRRCRRRAPPPAGRSRMHRLTTLSLRRPVTLAMALATVLLLGAISILKLPLDFLPRVEFPFIAVYIPYQGGIPAENEREIVRPIEEVLATLGGVREIFSYSDADEVQVGVTFDWGRDVNLLRMEVKEKIDQIRGRAAARTSRRSSC